MKRIANGWLIAGLVALCCVDALAAAADKPASAAADKPASATVAGDATPEQAAPRPWQVRRQKVMRLADRINASEGRDEVAVAEFDEVLTRFEADMVSITPMEAMDLMHVFYVPEDQGLHLDKILTRVVALATLGWYDALRFADDSGRAEIIDRERFFQRPFDAYEGQGTKDMAAYLKNHPKEAAEAVRLGVKLAGKLRGHVHYDEDWPSAYGQLAQHCVSGKAAACPKPTPLPKAEWDAAFEQAAARVEHEYLGGAKP